MRLLSFFFFCLFSSISAYSPSQEGQCNLCPGSSDVVCVDLETESPIGTFNGLHVQFDPVEMNAILVNTLFNSLNNLHLVPRNDSFRKHDCPELVDKQTDCRSSFRGTPEQMEYVNRSTTPWDRGHLAPSHAFTYSTHANAQVSLCLNHGPKDWYANQQPWNRIEASVLTYFNTTKAGYVMTGLCDQNAPGFMNQTLEGYVIPACYWKMVCYRDDFGATQVVSFIGNNSITRQGNADDYASKRATTCTVRSQQDVLDTMSINRWGVVMNAWVTGEQALLPGRNEQGAPPGVECIAKLTLDDSARNEWEARLASC